MALRVLVLPDHLKAELPFNGGARLRAEGEIAEHPISGAFLPSAESLHYIKLSPKLLNVADLSMCDIAEMRFRMAAPNAVAQAVWDDLTPGKERGFSIWVDHAKQRAKKTKHARGY